MNDAQSFGTGTIFTIGHSNHDLEKFKGLLKENGIEVVADIRSKPYSRFAPHFNKADLHDTLSKNGIKYLFLGKELGGLPGDKRFYDSDGRVIYDRIAESPAFHEGIERLIKGINEYRVALLCSEEDPGKCHRSFLVGSALEKRGIRVIHIRGDGRLERGGHLG